ncbi:extracellular solute-binding protein [Oceaniglobus roseus]|uniref:extracellular solute-binding protein n=1 Tax=Oceaniglobus roseus TaxID=1737570 RepID=UPI000C7F3A47|nr:extracellular solute-binding protein [Kandeliimicrobium roseum]
MPCPFAPTVLRAALASAALLLGAAATGAEPAHGIAMYGEPALPPEFTAFPYVNPEAPKGGRVVFAESGGFDSLNPHILKGSAPYGVGIYVFESLMARNWDEPFSLYGLLAESVETAEDRSWVEFTLRPEAKFSDGSPVTVEDVLWSYETLGTVGHPRYLSTWAKVEKAEATGPRTVRFTFNTVDRELPLILGLRPILKKAQYEGRDFAESTLDLVPIGSGPYTIGRFEPGRFIELDRDPDWWGADVPAMRGQHNIGQIRYDYFNDANVAFEAFKAGEVTAYRELNAAKWAEGYDFPAVRDGRIVKSEIPNDRPTGIAGFVMNTRRAPFDDWRVRDAMLHAFNFEYINQTLNNGEQPRIRSYFDNSVLAMDHGPATGRVKDLLAPYADSLLPGALDGYDLPVSDGTARNRAGLRAAMDRLNEAGWTVQDGVLKNGQGQPFSFEILLNQGATNIMGGGSSQQMIDIFTQGLERLGIFPKVTVIDSAQYTERTNAFDFGMAFYLRSVSLSPGNEQKLYWGSEAAGQPGSRNWMGAQSPAIDAMIDEMLTTTDADDFTAAVKALDRALTTGRYVIPIWYSAIGRIAHSSALHYPEDRVSIYGDWLGFLPDVWWYEE